MFDPESAAAAGRAAKSDRIEIIGVLSGSPGLNPHERGVAISEICNF